MKCPIEESIAIKVDEPEQLSAWELYQFLEKNGFVVINGIFYHWEEILMMIDIQYGQTEDEITKLYIDKIAELMDE